MALAREHRVAITAAAVLGMAVVTTVASGVAHGARSGPPSPRARHVAVSAPRPLVATGARRASSWAAGLHPVVVQNRNTGAVAKVRLYDDVGNVDDDAMRSLMRTVATPGNDETTEPMAPRLFQLVARASYHFGGKRVLVVSATRKGAHGKHGTGEAIDFALDGVRASVLAAYLRGLARVGVGIYTHPRTQYVHLDVREQSFHWLDGSPPGVTWRERRLPDPKQAKRDDAWAASADLPEVATTR